MINADILLNNSKWCEYLCYFINDNIKNSEVCNDLEQLYTELDKLKIYYSTLSNNCIISNFKITKDVFVKKKKLYLLSEILFWIKNEYESISYVEQDKYNEFFGECVDIYKKIVHADNCNIKNEYNTELNDFINNFNNAKAYLNENNKSISHDYLQSFNESRCQQELNGKQAEEVTDRRVTQEDNEATSHRGSEDEPAAEVLAESGLERVPGSRDVIADPVVNMRDSDLDVPKEQTDGNTSNPVGTIIGTSIGFVVLLITIYKFTPLGSWINTRILGRNNILKNMERNNQQLLLNSTENGEINLGETMYPIKYNS
ncbi:VIR protein [Plasmodium vivax]|uniref:VIR protein n=1 Tax=Plasmodium vivax TaxID=5855 RepID=A0A1G4EBP5_PLAVI|nr:VIR protein [Plasmodium vivax]